MEKECRIKISRMSPNKIFMFLIKPPSGNAKNTKTNSDTCTRMLLKKESGRRQKVNTLGLN